MVDPSFLAGVYWETKFMVKAFKNVYHNSRGDVGDAGCTWPLAIAPASCKGSRRALDAHVLDAVQNIS